MIIVLFLCEEFALVSLQNLRRWFWEKSDTDRCFQRIISKTEERFLDGEAHDWSSLSRRTRNCYFICKNQGNYCRKHEVNQKQRLKKHSMLFVYFTIHVAQCSHSRIWCKSMGKKDSLISRFLDKNSSNVEFSPLNRCLVDFTSTNVIYLYSGLKFFHLSTVMCMFFDFVSTFEHLKTWANIFRHITWDFRLFKDYI